jgi:hypothetical protein
MTVKVGEGRLYYECAEHGRLQDHDVSQEHGAAFCVACGRPALVRFKFPAQEPRPPLRRRSLT